MNDAINRPLNAAAKRPGVSPPDTTFASFYWACHMMMMIIIIVIIIFLVYTSNRNRL